MFKPFDRNQDFVLPPSLRELIPEGDLVYFIAAVIERLDLNPLYRRYDSLGQNAYHPGMMLGLLFYSYSSGIFSSRRIAEHLQFDVRFMYLSGMQRPDFRTIANFRKDNLALLQKYFVDIVRLCMEVGMVSLGQIAIDGTKIKASASKKRMKDRDALAEQLAEVKAEIAQLLEHAQSVDRSEDEKDSHHDPGSPLGVQLQNLQQIRDKLQRAKSKLDTNPGQKRVNTTDPDCREQKNIGPGYNSQIAVDSESQVIVGAKVVPDTNDSHQLIPMIKETETVTDSQGKTKRFITDSSYASVKAFRELENMPHIDAYVPTRELVNRQRHPVSDFDKSRFNYNLTEGTCICPMGHPMRFIRRGIRKNGEPYINFIGTMCPACPAKPRCTEADYRNLVVLLAAPLINKMQDKVASPAGRLAMSLRKQTVEPVIGILKEHLNFRCFHLRGLNKVNGEFALLCAAFNLKKMHRFLKGRKPAEIMVAAGSIIEIALESMRKKLISAINHLRFSFIRAKIG